MWVVMEPGVSYPMLRDEHWTALVVGAFLSNARERMRVHSSSAPSAASRHGDLPDEVQGSCLVDTQRAGVLLSSAYGSARCLHFPVSYLHTDKHVYLLHPYIAACMHLSRARVGYVVSRGAGGTSQW